MPRCYVFQVVSSPVFVVGDFYFSYKCIDFCEIVFIFAPAIREDAPNRNLRRKPNSHTKPLSVFPALRGLLFKYETEKMSDPLNESEVKSRLLFKALLKKGYTCQNPFISDITVKSTDDENVKDIEVCRWNTRRGWMVRLTAKWIEKESRWSISYYKKGKTGSNYQPV